MNKVIMNFIILLIFIENNLRTVIGQSKLPLDQEIELKLRQEKIQRELFKHKQIIHNVYWKRKDWVTSNLGTVIFKDYEWDSVHSFQIRTANNFTVFIYNEWSVLYTGTDTNDTYLKNMLNGCSVKNCIFTRNRKFREKADAILINVQKGQYPRYTRSRKNPKQIWVLLSMESPTNIFSGYVYNETLPVTLKNFTNKFNWVMNYRSDSDVPIPYGRTIPQPFPIAVDPYNVEKALATLVPFWHLKQYKYLVVTMVSNCGFKERMQFAKNLMKRINVDIYGDCAVDKILKKSCPGFIREPCAVLDHYIFYLALENSACRQYITEKVFYNAYTKGAIPIIWGAPLVDCIKLLPPNSFLHVDNYQSYEQLASHIQRISQDKKELYSYHIWRKHFKITNEHGFFGTQPMQFCRLCEALNFNTYPGQLYDFDDLLLYFNKNITCENMKRKIRRWKA